MVGAATSQNPERSVRRRLYEMGLMVATGANEPGGTDIVNGDDGIDDDTSYGGSKSVKLGITPAGFSFLFKARHAQVWDVIISYMHTLRTQGIAAISAGFGDRVAAVVTEGSPQREDDHRVALTFLFRLSFLKVGRPYAIPLLPPQRALLDELTHLGLVYRPKGAAHNPFFYPTPLTAILSSERGDDADLHGTASVAGVSALAPSAAAADDDADAQRFIICETTFRVYAFTSSPFHLALLARFMRVDTALPNMVMGMLTKQSVRSALQDNISADEIIHYMTVHAHRRVAGRVPPLPANVAQQLRLWEKEQHRMSTQPAKLWMKFANDEEFKWACAFAAAYRPRGLLAVDDTEASQSLVVTPGASEALRSAKQEREKRLSAEASASLFNV